MRNFGYLNPILKALLLVLVSVYVVLPVYLYGYTSMGPTVIRMLSQILSGKAAGSDVSPGVNGVQVEPDATPATPQPMTILLLGYGGEGHDGAYLTDSIVLAIADPKAKSLSLLSIPRDLYVKLPLDESGRLGQQNRAIRSKINVAYVYGIDQSLYPGRAERYKGTHGGGSLAKDVVATVTGLSTRYYVSLDFNTFRRIIDEVGGIDVTVSSAFTSLYPKSDNPEIDPDWTYVHFDVGRQHMDGERALQYSRARDVIDNPSEGGDFARSARQRRVMEEFKNKVMSPSGLVRIPGILRIVGQRVSTDIEVPGLNELQQLLVDWRGTSIVHVSLTVENFLVSDTTEEGSYILSPMVGMDNWSQIQAFVRLLARDPALAEEVARTKVIVRDGSGVPGKGVELRAKLISQGYSVAPLELVPTQPTSYIEDMTAGKVPQLIQSLKTILPNSDIPVKVTGFPSARVAIVLGQDKPSVTPLAQPTPQQRR